MSGFFSDLGTMVFFKLISDFLNHEADYFLTQILGNAYTLIGAVLLTVLTIWIMIHGYRIMSGQSREPLMGFMITAGKAFLIVGIATTWGANNGSWFKAITEGTTSAVHYLVTGDSNSDPFDGIDKNLALMQTGLGAIKSIDAGDSAEVESEKTQALWMSGVGTAGPAIVAGTLLFVNKFAWALFMGFGPIFILCLLFEQTKSMFQKWLQFGLGIITSLAVLSFMTDVAMRMVGAMTTATLARDFLGGSSAGFTQAAMQQGGLGLILTALIITVPNMAGNFLGTFTSGFSGANMIQGFGNPSGGGGRGSAPASNNPGLNPTGAVTTTAKGEGAVSTGEMNHGNRFSTGGSHVVDHSYSAPRSNSSMGLAGSGGGVASGIGADSASVKAAHHATPAALGAATAASSSWSDQIPQGEFAANKPPELAGAAAVGADDKQVATAPDAPSTPGQSGAAGGSSVSALPAAGTQGGGAAPMNNPAPPSSSNAMGAAAKVTGQSAPSAPSSATVNQAAGSRVNSSGSAALQQTRAAPVNPSRGA